MPTIVLILLVVSLMIGPIMMMRPSKRAAKTARMRILALSHGLKVTMQKRPGGEDQDMLPIYFLPWPNHILKKYPDAIDWTIHKENFEHDIHFHGGWDILDIQNTGSSTKLSNNSRERGKPPRAWHRAIKDFLDEHMQGNIGLTSSRAGLGVFWDERLNGRTEEEAVAMISRDLTTLAAKLT